MVQLTQPALLALFVACLISSSISNVLAQRAQDANTEVKLLLLNLRDDDSDVARDSARRLAEFGPAIASRVAEFIVSEKDCQARVLAAYVLGHLEPDNLLVVTTLRSAMLKLCYWDQQRDIDTRRLAAFALAEYPSGIDVLTQTLSDSNYFNRQSAVFALDDLTESSHLTTATIGALRKAIPALRAALADYDEVVSCMAQECLQQLTGSTDESLRDAAIEALRIGKPHCRE